MDHTVGRLQSLFPSHQVDVIIGSLLGDARLECRSVGKRYPISARLRIHQSEKQKEYVFWKYAQLENLVLKEPRRIKVWHDAKRNKDHYSWYFHTKTLKELGALYHYFYKDAVKIFPQDLFDYLIPRAIAIWFMDDGSNTKASYTISTHNFLLQDQERIVEFLARRFKISATIIKDRARFKIRIGRHEYQKFNNIIEPFIIPSMTHKICNPRNDLIQSVLGQIQEASLVV
ncbi:MAG: hypothetical protein HYW90_04705 [Candidatus Sungbacteria bacterium]|nr:hypothetical protein [Candidatus Sungbacteria bacterium]